MLRAVVCGAIGLAALLGVLLAVGVGAQSSPITLEQRTTSSLSVRWHWGGQIAAAFEVAWRPRGEDDRAAWRSARKQASERRHTISGLDAGVHYVVRVRALNAAGRPLGDLRAAFATDWSAPRLLRVTARADAALTIGWSAPTDWSPQGYRLRWRAAGAQTLSGDLTLPASASGRRLPGLSTGTAYLIRLTALNARGGESPPAVLTATAAGAPPAQPVLTDASWSELTLRAEWDAVARATGYDVRWNSADDQTPVSAEEAIETSPAEYAAPRTGLYTVAVRARIGSGPTAVRGEWSQPLSLRVLPAPGYLRVQNFDGERARLTWPGVGANGYVVEWGRRGGTKQTETRDGRSGVLEVGPLTVIAAYEFRVRARHQRGESGWSPTATMTPTIWPQLPPRAALNQGSLYVLWPPAAGAEWYEAQWINAADRDETARVRVAPPSGGGNVAARIGRDGGFEDGRWLVRVRAGPFGLWSQTYALDLAGQPPRLALELWTVGGPCLGKSLRHLNWSISGGVPPFTVTVGERQHIDAKLRWTVTVNCGPLPTDPYPCDPEPKRHQTFKAVVTDSRGVTAETELQVAVAEPPRRPKPGLVLSSASAGSASRLGWTAVTEGSDVCAYELRYQATDWDAASWPETWTAISEAVEDGGTEYLHSGLDTGRRYRYQVRARNNIGAGEWSRAFPEAGVRPGAPALRARTAASGSVALSWVAGATGATRWEYRQRPEGGSWGDWTRIADSNALTADHAVTGLTEDAGYQFQVRAIGATGGGPASATATAVAGLTPTVPSGREPIFYDDLDSTGGAATPGSYAFLTDAADLASGATTLAKVSSAEALLLNASGYVRRDYADALDAVEVGDRITWHPASHCWYHYRVTEILADPPAPARKLLRVALEAEDPCGSTTAQRGDPNDFDAMRDWVVAFGWDDDPPNEPEIGPDGIRILPYGYAVDGGHTYRLHGRARPTSIVIDVPVGMRLINWGMPLFSHGTGLATYEDEVTGSLLWLDPSTGRHVGFQVETPTSVMEPPAIVAARFDAIIASIREVPLP